MSLLLVSPRVISYCVKDGKVLMLKRVDDSPWKDTYMPIGGHIDPDEDAIFASDREFEEETGLKAQNTKLRGIVHQTGFYGKDVLMFVTQCNCEDGEPKSNEEGIPEWLEISKLDDIKTIKNSIRLLNMTLDLKEGEIFFVVSKFDGKDKELSFSSRISEI